LLETEIKTKKITHKVEHQAAKPVETKMSKEEEIDVDSETMAAFS